MRMTALKSKSKEFESEWLPKVTSQQKAKLKSERLQKLINSPFPSAGPVSNYRFYDIQFYVLRSTDSSRFTFYMFDFGIFISC